MKTTLTAKAVFFLHNLTPIMMDHNHPAEDLAVEILKAILSLGLTTRDDQEKRDQKEEMESDNKNQRSIMIEITVMLVKAQGKNKMNPKTKQEGGLW